MKGYRAARWTVVHLSRSDAPGDQHEVDGGPCRRSIDETGTTDARTAGGYPCVIEIRRSTARHDVPGEVYDSAKLGEPRSSERERTWPPLRNDDHAFQRSPGVTFPRGVDDHQ